jgi:ABC-type branched-subunit amino acid transport system ATPase component/ABC-type branched-subunit amino acid transport system permease subunit
MTARPVPADAAAETAAVAPVRPAAWLEHGRRAYAAALVLGVVWLLAFPLYTHDLYWQGVLFLCFLFAIMASGWNIISGFAGYVSLGQSAFMGLGAYTTALLALHLHVTPWAMVPLGGLLAAAVAAVLGVVIMRTRGHSFVIITIAFLLILQLVTLNWTSFTGGSNGLTLPITTYPRAWQYAPFYYALLGVLALQVLMSWWIRRTKFGTGLVAIREDEDKAGAVGVNTAVYKVLAFVASAVMIGVAGGVYAYYITFVDYRGMFNIQNSVLLVLAALLGGRGTVLGPVLGGFAVEILKEEANVHFGTTQLNLVVYGLVMAAVVLFLPRGIVPSIARWAQERADRAAGALASGTIDLRPAAVPAQARAPGAAAERRTLLEVDGLSKRFGGLQAVDGLSFTVEEGTITALIGPNGSGKTTAFNLITGMMSADAGRVTLAGRRIERLPTWERAHLGLGRTFQITRLFREMTVLENVVAPLRRFSWGQLAADAVAGHEVERALELLDFVGMARHAQVPARALSFGQQKLVELAQVLMLEPRLILLDEPAGGINPTLIARMADRIRELNRELGTTFLIVEHNMPLVAELCDPVIVLARGRRIAHGSAAEIQRDPAVLDAYLGEGWVEEEQEGVPA